MERAKQKIIEKKETENDDVVKENTVTYTSEDIQRRKVSNSVRTPETPRYHIIRDPEKEEEDRLRFNAFYLKLIKKIIDRDLVQDISILLQDTTEENTVRQKERFLRWNQKYKFQFNLWHLQEVLKTCGANDLVAECTKFADSCQMSLIYFDISNPDENRELVTIHTTMDISEKTTYNKMEKIRHSLATRLDLSLGDVHLRGVREGSLILVFSLPSENVKDIAHVDLSSIWELTVFKIETKARTWTPDWLKGTLVLYVQVELHCTRIQDCLQLIGLVIKDEMTVMGFHVKIDEHNITCTIGKQPGAQYPPKEKRKLKEDKQIPFEKEILENMEPTIIKEFLMKCLPGYHKEIEDLFSPTNARKQTAKAILLFLNGQKGKIFKNTTNCVIDMYRNKDIPTCDRSDSIDSAMTEENGLFQNTERLFDEIDSTIISDTFEKIGDVPFDIVQKCSPGSGRKRKERAKTFYDFVNLNKEHLQIFKNILQSNAD